MDRIRFITPNDWNVRLGGKMSWFPLKPYYASLGILHKHLIYMNKFCTAYLYIISIEKNQEIHFYYLGYMICLNHVSTKKTSKENVGSKERSCALKKSFWLKHLTYFPLVTFKSSPNFVNAYFYGFSLSSKWKWMQYYGLKIKVL